MSDKLDTSPRKSEFINTNIKKVDPCNISIRPRALVIYYDGCIPDEIETTIAKISDLVDVIIATPSGEDFVKETGEKISTDLAFSEVETQHYSAILIPGGDPGSLMKNTDIDNIIRNLDNNNGLVAAICAGPLLPAKAGILNNRKFTHGYEAEQMPFVANYFEGGTYVDDRLVVDANLITAKPEAFVQFAETVREWLQIHI